ncbi:hypothetical protein Peur_025987 [Populus x canadensis]
MVALTLSGCKNCILLPSLGQLPSLEELQIEGFDGVVKVSSEFYGSDSSMEKPFKSLKILKFEGMKNWQEWNTDVDGAFPHLAELGIRHCPKLTNALPSHLRCLLKLSIREYPQPVSEGDESRIIEISEPSSHRRCLHFRRDPQLKGREQMRHSDTSSCFTDIKIEGCERPLPALCHLTISHCPYLVSFPKGGLAARYLRSLVLEDCSLLKSLHENMHSLLHSLEDLQLISLPQVDTFPEGGLPSKLNTLCIVDCTNLKVCGLQALPYLSCFRFTGNDVESFDEETLPSTLTTLKIKRMGNLKSLDYKGLRHLTSLRKLSIQSCPKLVSISEQALPSPLEYLHLRTPESPDYMGLQHITSLRKLKIKSCPKLELISEQVLPFSLEYLHLCKLESLDYIGLQHITSLGKLKIWSCPKLASLQGLPSSLECLQLWDQRGRDYKELRHLTSLRTLNIRRSLKLEFLQEGTLPSALKDLEIQDLEDLDYKGFRHLTSLRKLHICNSPKLESVPGEELPSSLVSLKISGLINLKSVMGLQHLTSLRELIIWDCPQLVHLPREWLSLSRHRDIRRCPLLECVYRRLSH